VEKCCYIQNTQDKVERFVKSCVECLIIDSKRGKKEGLLTPIDKVQEPLGTYHIDHVGPLTDTKNKYNHILAVVDGFSKFVWLYPTRSIGTDEVLNRLEKQSAIFGNPRRIVTDRGTAFTSSTFRDYCSDHGIQLLHITTGMPRGNGQVERINKIVIPMLSKLCQNNQANWYCHVDKIQHFINDTPPRTTKYSPFEILTGLNMRKKDGSI